MDIQPEQEFVLEIWDSEGKPIHSEKAWGPIHALQLLVKYSRETYGGQLPGNFITCSAPNACGGDEDDYWQLRLPPYPTDDK